jgi:hypothetical protein
MVARPPSLLSCNAAAHGGSRASRGEGDVVAWRVRVGARHCLRRPEAANPSLKSNLATAAVAKGDGMAVRLCGPRCWWQPAVAPTATTGLGAGDAGHGIQGVRLAESSPAHPYLSHPSPRAEGGLTGASLPPTPLHARRRRHDTVKVRAGMVNPTGLGTNKGGATHGGPDRYGGWVDVGWVTKTIYFW